MRLIESIENYIVDSKSLTVLPCSEIVEQSPGLESERNIAMSTPTDNNQALGLPSPQLSKISDASLTQMDGDQLGGTNDRGLGLVHSSNMPHNKTITETFVEIMKNEKHLLNYLCPTCLWETRVI